MIKKTVNNELSLNKNHRALHGLLCFFKEHIIVSFLFVLTLIFFFPVIFQGKTFYAFDTICHYLPWSSYNKGFYANNILITDPIHAFYFNLFYPAHHFYQESVASGSLNLWFGFNFCGVPFTLYSYPFLYFFYTLFPLTKAHDFLLFFHLFGTGVFTYLYLTRVGLKQLPSIIGSIAWMFNGYVMVWFEYEHIPMMAMTLSATLYFIEIWWAKRSKLSFFCLTGAIALSICVFYAHVLIYHLIFIGLYMWYRFFLPKKTNRQEWKHSFHAFLGTVVAILVSLVISTNFFVTHITAYKDNQRQPIAYKELFTKTGQLPPKYLTTLLFPDFFGSPVMKKYFIPKIRGSQPYNNYNELCVYPGVMIVFLSLVCIPYLRNGNRYISFFMVTALLCLLMSMGSILYYPLWRFVPGLNISTPTRILYLFGFSVSMLAAFGANFIQSQKNSRKLPIALLWGFLLSTAFAIAFFVQTEGGVNWAAGSIKGNNLGLTNNELFSHFSMSSVVVLKPLLMVAVTFIILLSVLYSPSQRYKKILLFLGIILLSYDLISFGRLYNTASPKNMEFPSTPGIRFLQEDKTKFRIISFGSFMHNSFASFGIDGIGGYGSFHPKRYSEFLYLSQHGLDASGPKHLSRWISFNTFGSPLLDLINTKYILASPKTVIKSTQLKLAYDGEIKIYENLYAFPRVFFVPRYYYASSSKDAYHSLGRLSRKDMSNTVILESKPPDSFVVNNASSLNAINAEVNVISYRPNEIEFEVTSNSSGFVVVGDNYHPGWEAKIDGDFSKIFRANYIMRAIPVSSGKHKVVMTFRPKILIAGLVVTIIGWVVLSGAILWCLIRRYLLDRKNRIVTQT